MTKEDIIRKLTSRKFWVAIAMFVVALLSLTGVIKVEDKTDIYQLIILGGTCVAYILGEGLTDITHQNNYEYIEEGEDE